MHEIAKYIAYCREIHVSEPYLECTLFKNLLQNEAEMYCYGYWAYKMKYLFRIIPSEK